MKIMPGKHGRYRYYDSDDDNIFLLIIALIVWLIYWAIFFGIDWLLGGWIKWYLQPFTIFLWLPFVVIAEQYGRNPLHWWPVFWGHTFYIWDHPTLMSWPALQDALGKDISPRNVYIGFNAERGDYIKFRRRKDAVFYALKTS